VVEEEVAVPAQEGPDQDRTPATALSERVGSPGATAVGSDDDIVIDLRDSVMAAGNGPVVTVGRADLVEQRLATQRARYLAVVVIAVLNGFDLITTYAAIAAGAHEGNPLVAWMIESRLVVVAKVVVCGFLIAGAVLARRWKRRVTLPALCAAWAVVGVYSLVVLLNTINLLSRL
jgi:hypothetical protein